MRELIYGIILLIMVIGYMGTALAQDKFEVNTGVDLYNRYVWRGLDIAMTPSIQPSMSLVFSGFEIGAWGAYTLSNQNPESDEIDFWFSYTLELENGPSFSLLATDYYFPNGEAKLFNFNNHDNIDGSGAHTIELGLSCTGPKSFPVTISGYMNVYNDAGSNTYFQLDYPVNVGETELGFFFGFAGGSKDNPDYYGTETFNAINIGINAGREIKVSDSFSLPLTFSLIVNPMAEISYLLVGAGF